MSFSDSLYSPEITEAAARSNLPSIGQRTPLIVPQCPSIIPSFNEHQSIMTTPLTPHNGHPPSHSGKITSYSSDIHAKEFRFFLSGTPDDDHLPSYTDLFVVPSHCQESKRRRNTYSKN